MLCTTNFWAITKTVGATGADYATLGAAFTDINGALNGMTGTIELQIIDNTTETAAAVLSKAGVTVTIYPTVTGKKISGAVAGNLIQLGSGINNVVSNITIDGRLRNSSGVVIGSTPDLTIENTSNNAAATTIYFYSASGAYVTNSKVTYCNLKGSSQMAEDSGGMIHFNGGHASQIAMELSYNKITASGGVRPINAVWVNASTAATQNLKIINNNFENVIKNNGVRIHNRAQNFEISGNSFYETVVFTPSTTYCCIKTSGSNDIGMNGLDIKNNYLGGSGPECAGTMTTTSGDFNQQFRGISIDGSRTRDGYNIYNNVIKNITWTTNGANGFIGIYLAVNTTSITPDTPSKVYSNFISNVTFSNTVGASDLAGIYHAQKNANIYNNVISLGTNHRAAIYGIRTSNTSYNVNGTSAIYNNTVYIQGSPTVGSSEHSYAYHSSSNANSRDIRNNIFYNARTNSGTATNKHYAVYLNYSSMATSPVTFTCDYNDYYVTGTSGTLGHAGTGTPPTDDKTTLGAFQTATGQDANSTDASPGITPGSTPESFKGTVALAATTIAGVTTDFTGNTRSASPLMGAYESAVWNGSAWAGTTASTMSAVINGNYSGAGFDCLDLIVNPAKQVTISSGTLAVDGNLTLKSDATNGTATFIDNGGSLTVNGTTKVEQHLSNGRNWYISSPVSDATSNVFAASATNPMYYYVETTPNAWSSITNTTTNLDSKKGYIANINGDRVVTFTGGSLNTGEQTIGSLTSGGATMTGFNLVGNPYPSYLSWNGAARTNVGTTIWYRSKSTGAYLFQTYNQDGGGSTNGGTNLIPPMQAFWVKVDAGQTGSIVFDGNDRAHNDQSVATNRLKAPAADTRKTLRLEVSNGVNADETLIYADENALNGFDTYDSNKMFTNSDAVPELYTVLGTEKLAINGFNDITANQQLALGFKTSTVNTFSIKATEVKNFEPGTVIILKDNTKPNEEFNLIAGNAYSFSSDIANNHTRFSLIFRSSGSVSAVTSAGNNESLKVFTSNRQIVVSGAATETEISVFNTLGQRMLTQTIRDENTTLNRTFVPGIYLVSVDNVTRKIIIE